MFTLKNEPQSSLSILEQSFTLYKETLWQSLPYSLFATFFVCLPHLLTIIQPLFKLDFLTQHHLNLWIIGICWIMSFSFFGALIFRLYCHCYHIPCHYFGSLQHALFKLISLLLMSALYALIVLSGTMLLIIPGIILAISLMFSFILILTDNQQVLQTLTLSHRLVWGHWWHTAIIISVPLLINLAMILTAWLVLMSILFQHGLNPIGINLVSTGITFIIQTIFVPFIFSVALVLLHDLRQRVTKIPKW